MTGDGVSTHLPCPEPVTRMRKPLQMSALTHYSHQRCSLLGWYSFVLNCTLGGLNG